jgi:hypothetical protein
VNLRMANAAGKKLDQHLVRRRIRKLDFIDDQGLVGFEQNCRPALCAHAFSPFTGQIVSEQAAEKASYPSEKMNYES